MFQHRRIFPLNKQEWWYHSIEKISLQYRPESHKRRPPPPGFEYFMQTPTKTFLRTKARHLRAFLPHLLLLLCESSFLHLRYQALLSENTTFGFLLLLIPLCAWPLNLSLQFLTAKSCSKFHFISVVLIIIVVL